MKHRELSFPKGFGPVGIRKGVRFEGDFVLGDRSSPCQEFREGRGHLELEWRKMI